MTTVFYSCELCAIDLDEVELTDADMLPLSDEDSAALLAQLDPFQACYNAENGAAHH